VVPSASTTLCFCASAPTSTRLTSARSRGGRYPTHTAAGAPACTQTHTHTHTHTHAHTHTHTRTRTRTRTHTHTHTQNTHARTHARTHIHTHTHTHTHTHVRSLARSLTHVPPFATNVSNVLQLPRVVRLRFIPTRWRWRWDGACSHAVPRSSQHQENVTVPA
jgi:hypothetical protein